MGVHSVGSPAGMAVMIDCVSPVGFASPPFSDFAFLYRTDEP